LPASPTVGGAILLFARVKGQVPLRNLPFFENSRIFATQYSPPVPEELKASLSWVVQIKKALRGRPSGTTTKKSTMVRFDSDVLDAFKWQLGRGRTLHAIP